tara:strand:- start:163 stop:348 length:186 start_codon:yes stop_codon:yes gene_type:complete
MVVRICLSDEMRKDDDFAVDADGDVEEEDAVDDDAVKKNDKEAGDDGLSDKFNNLKLEMRI